MDGCIFCRIVDGTAPSYRVAESQNYLAILDIIPAVDGQTIILSKQHKDSYVLALDDDELAELTKFAKDVAKRLEACFRVNKVQMIFAGTSVNHLHAKLYPTESRITPEGKKETEEKLRKVQEAILGKA